MEREHTACCVLHNICILENDDTEIDPIDGDDDGDYENDDGPPNRAADGVLAALVRFVAEN